MDPVDHSDFEDYGIDPDRPEPPDPPLSGKDIDLALATLIQGLQQGIDAAEFETLIKDLYILNQVQRMEFLPRKLWR